MRAVGVYEAKTQLPRLLDRVRRGERITITRHGVPIAVLVPALAVSRRPVGKVIADLEVFGKGRRLAGSLRTMIAQGRR